MMASWFNNFGDMPDAFFDVFDLTLEDVEENQEEVRDGQVEQISLPPLEFFDNFFNDCSNAHADDLGIQNSSTTLHEESSSTKLLPSNAIPTSGKSIINSDHTYDAKFLPVFQTTSPVSVLESSKSPHAEKRPALDLKVAFVKGPRSKRQRPGSFKLAAEMSFTSTAKKKCLKSEVIEEPEDLSEAYLSDRYIPNKHNGKNLSLLSNALDGKKFNFQQPFATRKCTHCETTSTPQWREGPQGPKTLCNACGVRYRTGRLFPEYRPAGSPTFVASLHSNSHRKVMELRNKAKQDANIAAKTHRVTSQ